MKDKEHKWRKIQQYIRSEFNIEPNVYNILYLIGIRELGYGFERLDHGLKTKVFNFVSIYIMQFLSSEEKKKLRNRHEDDVETEKNMYKTAVINYFESQKIL